MSDSLREVTLGQLLDEAIDAHPDNEAIVYVDRNLRMNRRARAIRPINMDGNRPGPAGVVHEQPPLSSPVASGTGHSCVRDVASKHGPHDRHVSWEYSIGVR